MAKTVGQETNILPRAIFHLKTNIALSAIFVA